MLQNLKRGQPQSTQGPLQWALSCSPEVEELEWWCTGYIGCFKLSYLHGMKLAMVTRSGGWNPGPQ